MAYTPKEKKMHNFNSQANYQEIPQEVLKGTFYVYEKQKRQFYFVFKESEVEMKGKERLKIPISLQRSFF